MKKISILSLLSALALSVGCGQPVSEVQGDWQAVSSIKHGALMDAVADEGDCLSRLRFDFEGERVFAEVEEVYGMDDIAWFRLLEPIHESEIGVASGQAFTQLNQFALDGGLVALNILDSGYTPIDIAELRTDIIDTQLNTHLATMINAPIFVPSLTEIKVQDLIEPRVEGQYLNFYQARFELESSKFLNQENEISNISLPIQNALLEVDLNTRVEREVSFGLADTIRADLLDAQLRSQGIMNTQPSFDRADIETRFEVMPEGRADIDAVDLSISDRQLDLDDVVLEKLCGRDL